jgi:class 3 adenylate cyclase
MQEIADWLETLGMSEYAQCFAENRIDLAVLPELSDQDLKDLGVVLGDRRKILRAIADLKSTTTVAPNPARGGVTIARPQDAAERRQVTVMFSDLVGSTALSARMDPEDLRGVITAYQRCLAETVQRFGGFVAKYMGDGALVYFGYPQAHEDDADRAVRTGLKLVTAVNALKTGASLQTHVGIATGLVVVGAGARHRRRDTEPCGPSPRDRRAGHRCHRREHANASWQSIRTARPRPARPQRHGRPSESLGCGAIGFSRKPFRGYARRRTD